MEKSTFLSRVVPGTLLGRVLLFFLLPTTLLLGTLWAALFAPSPLTPYLAGLLLFGSVMSVKYREKGLGITYALLIGTVAFFARNIEPELRLWQLGVCLTAALDFFILLLASAEIEQGIAVLVDESKSRMNQYLAKNQELLEQEQSWSETKERLEQELARWKEEAEQRKIEMSTLKEKMQLIQSEIEMLTAQKESIIDEAHRMRQDAAGQMESLRSQMAEVEVAREQIERQKELQRQIDAELEQEKGEFAARYAALQEDHLADLEKREQEFKVCFSQLQEELEKRALNAEQEAERLLAKSVDASVFHGEIAELKRQLQEKESLQSEIKEASLKEVTELKRQLKENESLQSEIAELKSLREVSQQEVAALKQQLEEKEAAQRDIVALNEKIQESTTPLQEEIAALKRQLQEKESALPVPSVEFDRELAKAEGLYKQLRSQFDEKSRVLVQTRKELFQTQGKLKELELEEKLHELDGERCEAAYLEKDLNTLCRDYQELENEIAALEEFISNLLRQR